MNSLPIESTLWREHLKQRIGMETSILRFLIQWGMAESAFDVWRCLEDHFGDPRQLMDFSSSGLRSTEDSFEICFEMRTCERATSRVAG